MMEGLDGRPTKSTSIALTIAVYCLVAFLAVGLFSQTIYNSNHNEQMYIAAGYLLAQGHHLYEDFAFVQMPYAPRIYAFVYRMTGAGYYLYKARVANYLFLAIGALFLFSIVRRIGRNRVFTATVLLLFFSNYYLLRAAIEASNYTIPIAFSLFCYVLVIRGISAPQDDMASDQAAERVSEPGYRFSILFLAGVFLAAAIGAKLYYATLAAPFGLAVLLYPAAFPFRRRLQEGFLPLVTGAVAGLAPALILAIRNPDRFYFNNLGYHILNATWREQNSAFETMTWASKLDTARDLLGNPNYLILVAWLALAFILWRQQSERHSQTPSRLAENDVQPAMPEQQTHPLPNSGPDLFLATGLSLVAIGTAFMPRPLFTQYFAMPIPYLLLLMAALYARCEAGHRRVLGQLALVVAAISTIIILPRHTSSLRKSLIAGKEPAGIVAVETSHDIRRALREAGLFAAGTDPKVATLSPIYALETHLPFYPELATGSFVYRIGDLLSAEERRRFVATSPSTIAQLLEDDPPGAILIGDEGDLESPLREFARTHDYRPVDVTLDTGELFVR